MINMNQQYETKQLTIETWNDFETLFAKHNGVWGGCWCTFHQLSSSEFKNMTKENRRDYHKKRVEDNLATGLILYSDSVPIGWCQFGSGDVFEQLNRSRAYKEMEDEKKIPVDWRITCIFVDKHHRKRGLMALILSETLKMIKNLGGGMVEAFPFDFPDSKKPNYNGTVRLFEREGFEKITRLGKSTQLMRKYI